MLIKLQKERRIVLKQCNKGADIRVLYFKYYLKSCMDHLEAKTTTWKSYYKPVNISVLKEAKEKISNIVKEGFDNKILTKEEYGAMTPAENVEAGRFYGTFKVHKPYEHGTAPSMRGIVRYSGTLMENIALYVENHWKPIGKYRESYLEDTPYFLRYREEINKGQTLSTNSTLVVIDAIGLYDNIPPEEGVQSVGEELKEIPNSKVPPGFIMSSLN